VTAHAVDINCDLGESFGAFHMGDDASIMPWITSANVACGFHGGDPGTIAATVDAAGRFGVGVGAHPSFPDLVGFGRRYMHLTPEEVETDVLYQIGALSAFTRAAGVGLLHVKPHGQLNNVAVRDRTVADAIARAVCAFDPGLILVAYGGELIKAGEAAGLTVAYEAYADRGYQADGSLVPRSRAGAMIEDVDRVVSRAVAMVREQRVTAVSGEIVPLRVDTICVHSDTSGAVDIARALNSGLRAAGIAVRPMAEVIARSEHAR
jgi:UPF0271 protein